MVQETEYHFDDDATQNGKKAKVSAMAGFGKFIWNSETKEFCGRDGASWGKVSLFYAVFYACLGSFFIGMLAVFMAQMPKDKPTYYGQSSTMNARGVNPGLGFRPQIDVEDSLIYYNPMIFEASRGYIPFVQNLKNFLNAKYKDFTPAEDNFLNKACQDGQTYHADLQEKGLSCQFDYKKVFQGTDCTVENEFGFKSNKACILLKLNKIISWNPDFDGTNQTAVEIRCTGETSADKDNLVSVTYHSEGKLSNSNAGYIDGKYFPYFAQQAYRAPFIFAQFEVPANTLVNIECRAFAKNIDNTDRLNRRGMTKFSILVANKKE